MTPYKPHELRALRKGISAGQTIAQIANALGRDRKALYRRAIADGLIESSRRYRTEAEIERIRSEYPDAESGQLAAAMGLTINQVYRVACHLGIKKSEAFYASDRSTRIRRGKQNEAMIRNRFQAGHATWNKGLVGLDIGGKETRFRKGDRPHTWRPIGSERVNHDGYLDRKMTDTGYPPRDWVAVHRLVWIAANGPIPHSHIVVFKSGMRTAIAEQVTTDKLECISRIENMRRNTVHNYPQPIPKLVQLRGALNRKINRRGKP